ncbi:MAG: amidase [Alphaproteobacteria bacterium]|nr:amidase [Alphaproteobacteria bacterium]
MLSFEEYVHHDALGLAALIREGEVTAVEVVDAALARADAVDPAINALVARRDDLARGQATLPARQGIFDGVPFVFKDLFCWQEGWPAEAGSNLWKGFVAPVDFTHVRRVAASGAIAVARTTSSEYGLSITTESAAHGPTRNPWSLDRSAGGSSGGTAAAVAAGIVPMGHGSDGGGSIRIPAANCGLFGLKPTRGRNPFGPFVGEGWAGLATQHVLSRSVRDSAAMLDVTHGPELGEPYGCPPPAGPYLSEVGTDPGRLRVAFHRTGLGGTPLDPVNEVAVADAVGLLEALGHEVEEAHPQVDLEALAPAMMTVVGANQKLSLDSRYAELGRWPEEGDVEPVTRAFADYGGRVTAADYAAAVQTFHALGRRFGAFFERYDVLVSTVLGQPPARVGEIRTDTGDADAFLQDVWNRMPVTQFFNVTGCPAMSVPLHWCPSGLPIGIHIGAGFGREDVLFRLAGQLERVRPWFHRRPAL